MKPPIPKALTIAGSDSGGGAGIQADLKTFLALGVHGSCVVTALTAQNSTGVLGVEAVSPAFIALQYEAVMIDIGADAAKTGMLADRATIEAVTRALDARPIERLVVDPVTIATSGARLLADDAVEALTRLILPRAALLTPNLDEARVLTGLPIADANGIRAAAEALLKLGPRAVLVKGGHFEAAPDRADDFYLDGSRAEWLRAERIPTIDTHGSGCTLSAAAAAFLARGCDALDAARRAKDFTRRCIERAYRPGAGPGPLWQGAGQIGAPMEDD
jgi:hydroxymethylpyrimidine/phosphomethylpyrimidine kinase